MTGVQTCALPISAPAAPEKAAGPFAFADPARIETILREAGFAPPVIEPLDFDFRVGAGDEPLADALGYFTRIGPMARLLAGLDEAARAGSSNPASRRATGPIRLK